MEDSVMATAHLVYVIGILASLSFAVTVNTAPKDRLPFILQRFNLHRHNNKSMLGAACACAISLSTAMPAGASFVVSGGSVQNLPITGNDFNTELISLGFSQMNTGGQLRVSEDGFIDFYYVGAESSFNNTFTAQGNALSGNNKGFLTEHDEAFNFSGYAGFTIAVSANDILNFSFTSDNATALTPVSNFSNINLQGLGIYFDPSQSGSLQQVMLGYDDQVFDDDNDFEDMLVRADFRPSAVIPLPAAIWLFGSGLLGLIGISKRIKAN
jgi:hypothetical protein